MNPFQSAYNWLKGIRTPLWLKVILQEIQDILIQIALQVGQSYITNLQNKIIEVSQANISNDEKFGIVFTYGKKEFLEIKDSYLNLLIEVLVNRLKQNRVV